MEEEEEEEEPEGGTDVGKDLPRLALCLLSPLLARMLRFPCHLVIALEKGLVGREGRVAQSVPSLLIGGSGDCRETFLSLSLARRGFDA